MRHMSFMLTRDAVLNKTKTVTRRLGWWNVTPGERLQADYKCQGLKKGERVQKLGEINVISHKEQTLAEMLEDPEYAKAEVIKEGFPHLTPEQFVAMFCEHNGCTPETYVNRIEFDYGPPRLDFKTIRAALRDRKVFPSPHYDCTDPRVWAEECTIIQRLAAGEKLTLYRHRICLSQERDEYQMAIAFDWPTKERPYATPESDHVIIRLLGRMVLRPTSCAGGYTVLQFTPAAAKALGVRPRNP
jgi:hypothetical protein